MEQNGDGKLVCPNDGTELSSSPPLTFPFKDRFNFVSELGSGGMATIYQRRDQPLLKKNVAIKVLHPHMANDKNLRRFQKEAQAISSLDHLHIVRVIDFGVSELQQPYMVMEFAEGEALSESLKKNGTISVAASVPIFMQICDAMSHAHAKGILHRDLKPSNIMMTGEIVHT